MYKYYTFLKKEATLVRLYIYFFLFLFFSLLNNGAQPLNRNVMKYISVLLKKYLLFIYKAINISKSVCVSANVCVRVCDVFWFGCIAISQLRRKWKKCERTKEDIVVENTFSEVLVFLFFFLSSFFAFKRYYTFALALQKTWVLRLMVWRLSFIFPSLVCIWCVYCVWVYVYTKAFLWEAWRKQCSLQSQS